MLEPEQIEITTTMAIGERAKLRKSLRRVDMLFFLICAMIGLDTLGQVSSYGAQTFTWLIVLAVLFLLPYALLMAEIGSAFPQEGGPYEWMKLSWGRLTAGIGAVLYWVSNPLWVGGSLAFIATEAWNDNLHGVGSGSLGDYLFKIAFIWVTIGVAIISLRRGKWIPNVGAVVRVSVLAFFSLTVVIYAIEHGVHGYGAGHYQPTLAVFLGLVPLLLFNYVGFEIQSGAAEEMVDPTRDVPTTVIQSGIVTVIVLGVPIFGIVAVLPPGKISGIGGFLQAVHTTFTVYGGAGSLLADVMAIGFIFALATSGAVWMMGSDRVQAVAAYDGAFAPWFGVFSDRLGTPVRVNVMSGVVSTAFMLAAVHFATGSSADTFQVVLYLATSTTLLSYLLIFPTVLKLRYSHPQIERPYRVPFGIVGVWVSTASCFLLILLGSWVALFPGTLESALGVDYGSFRGTWGVSRLRFEAFTLGTLAVILAIALVGYATGASVRRETATRSIAGAAEPGAVGLLPE